jgi:SAM-dependent methyltransferase
VDDCGRSTVVRDWREVYLRRYYSAKGGWVDGTTEFFSLIADSIQAGSRIMDVGAGPTNRVTHFLAGIGRVTAVDRDPAVTRNSDAHEAFVISSDQYPFGDNTIDACVSNYVLEHVDDPRAHLREVFRVLKPGGAYIFRTPNLLHYTSLVSRLTPHWFHVVVADRLRNLPAGGHDPYPTRYRINSERTVRRVAADAGFRVEVLRLVEKEPSYGLSSRILFLLFVAYERFVNKFKAAALLRSNIFCVLRKP